MGKFKLVIGGHRIQGTLSARGLSWFRTTNLKTLPVRHMHVCESDGKAVLARQLALWAKAAHMAEARKRQAKLFLECHPITGKE